MVSRGIILRDLQGLPIYPSSYPLQNTHAAPILFQLTDQFEGSLIRVFRRLGELLRQMAQAAKVIGNSELKEKFEKASEMLERPNSVIFCSSLYL
jgi:superfamily II RNA helicase